jgi:chromosome partitioning protein
VIKKQYDKKFIKQSYIVAGLSDFGKHIVRALALTPTELLVIDQDPKRLEDISDIVLDTVCADAADPDVLSQLGIAGFDGAVVDTENDLERKVLIIDADPQANTTSGLNFPPESDQKRTLYEVMIGQIGVRDALIQTEMNHLHLIPSHINLVGIEFEMINEENRESILKNCLAPIRNEYDYIIIDCSPSLGLMTINCLTAADSVIIPVQPEFFALEGLGKLLQTIRLVEKGVNPNLTIEGFVVTMFDGRTRVHTQVVNDLREHFKDMVFKTIIQRSIRLSEAPSHGKPIVLYDVVSNGTTNYLNLAKEVMDKNE